MKKMKKNNQMGIHINKYMNKPAQYFMEIWMLNYSIIYHMMRKKDEQCFPRWYL